MPRKSPIAGTVKSVVRKKKQKQNLQIHRIRSVTMLWAGGGAVRKGTRRSEVGPHPWGEDGP